jgi:hypothetical protein
VTCLSRQTLKCGDLPSWGPSPGHHGVALAVAWVTRLSVGLGLTPDLIDS